MKNTIPQFDPHTSNLLTLIHKAAASCLAAPIYLVGGTLRDHLLGREVKDLDFVTEDDTGLISREVKNALKAQFFILDDQRQTARVIYELQDGQKMHLDFVRFTGNTLEEDLRNRDFTINAMAVDLNQPGELIDPLNGRGDLKEGILRSCSVHAMNDDPLRVLRGVRLILAYELSLDSASKKLMVEAASKLGEISSERLRDELFNIFSLAKPAKAIELIESLGCLQSVLPEMVALKTVPASSPHVYSLWDHTLKTAEYLQELLSAVVNNDRSTISTYPHADLLFESIWTYQLQLKKHFIRPVHPDRSRAALLTLAAFYHDAGKPAYMQVDHERRLHFRMHAVGSQLAVTKRASALALSNREVEYLSIITANHMRIHDLSKNPDLPSPGAIHRFFRDCSEFGIDICLLSLADMWATYEESLEEEKWIRELDVVKSLLIAWYSQKHQLVNPPRLLTGDDLINELQLQPGPSFSIILEKVLEAQINAEVRTREEALAYVRKMLIEGDKHEQILQ